MTKKIKIIGNSSKLKLRITNDIFDAEKFMALLGERILSYAKAQAPGQHAKYGKIKFNKRSVVVYFNSYYSNRLEHGVPEPGRWEEYHDKNGNVKKRFLKPYKGKAFMENGQNLAYKDIPLMVNLCLKKQK
jgi:hypothetical protein